MTTRTTTELALSLAVPAIGKPAGVAPLARVSGVYPDNTTANSLRLVFEERAELSERPCVDAPLGIPSGGLYAGSDVREVFDNNGRSGFNSGENALAENVVAIASESLFASREASKMTLGRLRAFRLQISLKTEPAFAGFPPSALAVEPVVGCHGRAAHTEINTEGGAVIHKLHVGQFEDDVKGEAALPVNEVGGGRLVFRKGSGVFRQIESDVLPPVHGRHVHRPLAPIHLERVEVVARGANRGLWASDFTAILFQGESRLDGFRRFLTGLNVKVRNEVRKRGLTLPVGQLVERVGVPVGQTPAFSAHGVEGPRELTHGFKQAFSLFRGWFQRYSKRSVHTFILPYNGTFLQEEGEDERWGIGPCGHDDSPCRLKATVPSS